jgi:hypothetical protein
LRCTTGWSGPRSLDESIVMLTQFVDDELAAVPIGALRAERSGPMAMVTGGERGRHEQIVETLEERLGNDTFAALLRRHETMSDRAVIEYAIAEMERVRAERYPPG